MDVTLIVILSAAFLAAVIAGGILIATHEAELRSLEEWEDEIKPEIPITSIRRVK